MIKKEGEEMNCDNCRWFNKNGFAPGFGDCALHRKVHSAKHEVCEHYEEYEKASYDQEAFLTEMLAESSKNIRTIVGEELIFLIKNNSDCKIIFRDCSNKMAIVGPKHKLKEFHDRCLRRVLGMEVKNGERYGEQSMETDTGDE